MTIAPEPQPTPAEASDIAQRRADVVRRLLARGVTAETLAVILPDLEADIVAVVAEESEAEVEG